MILARDFSWQRRVGHFGSEDPRIHLSGLPHGFSYATPYQLKRTSNSALTYLPASSLHFTSLTLRSADLRQPFQKQGLNGHRWLPNMNGMSIAYASQPRLRTRLTLRRLT